MKTTLAIDTATPRTQFAILQGDELKWLQVEEGATTHGDVLEKFGKLAAREKIDQVIVGMGPGPFTGLRTGIIFAQSFAFARGLPFHGICSLDAIAHGIDLPEFIVTTDARRKERYWARYVDGIRIGEPEVSSASDIPKIKSFNDLYPNLLSFPHLAHVNEPMYLRHPDAVPTAERK